MSLIKIPSELITRDLGTRFMGKRVLYYPSVSSTNELAKEEARRQAPEGTVVIASEQTAGKGRLSRTWKTPPGAIAVSYILYPSKYRLPELIMVASLAVVHAIKEVTGLAAGIKWPNDIQIKGKKVCGILIENGFKGDAVEYSVTGIGINVNVNLADYPDIVNTATSLSTEVGREVSIVDITKCLLTEAEELYLKSSVFEEWRDNLVTLGKPVTATSGRTVYHGIAESVDRDGSLCIRLADGSLVKVNSGEVTLRTKII